MCEGAEVARALGEVDAVEVFGEGDGEFPGGFPGIAEVGDGGALGLRLDAGLGAGAEFEFGIEVEPERVVDGDGTTFVAEDGEEIFHDGRTGGGEGFEFGEVGR
jgi:hypothetical protein